MMRLLLALVAIVTAQTVWVHDGVIHKSDEEAAAHAAAVPAPSGLPFPVKLGGPFTLTDQNGAPTQSLTASKVFLWCGNRPRV